MRFFVQNSIMIASRPADLLLTATTAIELEALNSRCHQ